MYVPDMYVRRHYSIHHDNRDRGSNVQFKSLLGSQLRNASLEALRFAVAPCPQCCWCGLGAGDNLAEAVPIPSLPHLLAACLICTGTRNIRHLKHGEVIHPPCMIHSELKGWAPFATASTQKVVGDG